MKLELNRPQRKSVMIRLINRKEMCEKRLLWTYFILKNRTRARTVPEINELKLVNCKYLLPLVYFYYLLLEDFKIQSKQIMIFLLTYLVLNEYKCSTSCTSTQHFNSI